MENNIILKIGTVFNGEGMQKLANATQGVNSQIKQSSIVATKLSSAFGQLDTAGSKCMTAVTGLIGAFTQGGVQGAIFAGVIMSINAYFDKQKQKAEELKQRIKEMGDQIMSTFSGTLNEQVNAVTTEISNITKSFDNATSAAKAFSGAVNDLNNSQSTGGIIALEIAKFQAVLDATSEAEAKHAEAAYNLQIQEAKNALANEQAAQKVESATEALATSREREQILIENRAKAEEELTHLENTFAITTENQTAVRKQLTEKITTLKSTITNLDQDITKQSAETKRLAVAEQTALQNQTNVRNQGVLAITQLNAATKKETLASEESAKKKEEETAASAAAAAQKKMETDAREELRSVLQEEKDAQTKAKEAAANLAKAEEDLQKAIEEYEKNYTRNEMNKAVGDAKSSSGLKNIYGILQNQIPAIAAGAREAAIKQGIANGKIQTVDDAVRVGNEATKASAKEAHEIAVKQANEALRADRLEKMSEKAMSDADKKWLEQYKQVEEGRKQQREIVEKAKEAKAEAEKKLEEANKNQADAAKSLSNIEKKLTELGLK